MKRVLLSLALACVLAAPVGAEETAADKLKANPNSTDAINAYMNEGLRQIVPLLQKDPDAAQKKLDEMKAFLAEIKPDQQAATALLQRTTTFLNNYERQIELARIPLTELEKKVDQDPNDQDTFGKYVQKALLAISPLARAEPDQAGQLLKDFQQRVKKTAEVTTNPAVKTQVTQLDRQLASIERAIESGRKLNALIGKDAAPLEIEAWVNGKPLSDAELKGKVVLLDFWAVWCGPCIATFPHLREWHEKYSDKGLVIIGLTRYYNYSWDDAANKASRSAKPVSAESEQEMLKKFAEQHNLHHRFAIQKKESGLDDFYSVTGIPHVVVIDQEGKVRLMRVGSGEANAKAVGDMLEQLLAKTGK